MMGGEAPETWATHKRQVINLWNCCILLVDLFESYVDARTSERQIQDSAVKWMKTALYWAYYAASSSNSIPKFRDNLSVQSLRVKMLGFLVIEDYLSLEIGLIVCPETSVRNYNYSPRKAQFSNCIVIYTFYFGMLQCKKDLVLIFSHTLSMHYDS